MSENKKYLTSIRMPNYIWPRVTLVIDTNNKTHSVEEKHRGWMHTTGGILSDDEIKLIARFKNYI